MTLNDPAYHVPVMLRECLEGLNIVPSGTYVDVTFGGGGHSRAIFDMLNNEGKLIAFDQDPDAMRNVWSAPNFHFIPSNFSFISNHLRMLGVRQVDGILADLGVSSHQFDEPERGFTIRATAPLDMRMNRSGELTAQKILNGYGEDELIRIFKTYGELPNARKAAAEIVRFRTSKKFKTTADLMEALKSCAPRLKEHKYFAQVFQALRIEVNGELEVLERFLEQSAELLRPGGRMVVMSYHSLEDRIVKNFFKRGSFDGEIQKDFFGNVIKPFDEVVRHPVIPSEDEIAANPRSRSAKLRIAEKR